MTNLLVYVCVIFVILSAAATITVGALALNSVADEALIAMQWTSIALLGITLFLVIGIWGYDYSKDSVSLPGWFNALAIVTTVASIVLVGLHIASVGTTEILYAFEVAVPSVTLIALAIAAALGFSAPEDDATERMMGREIGSPTDAKYVPQKGAEKPSGPLAAALAGWTPSVTDAGEAYYYNTQTGETSWELPAEFRY